VKNRLQSLPFKCNLRRYTVGFAGVSVNPGDWVYADMDGILVSPHKLEL
jgi:regulator of RNase E activity RraA